MGLFGAMTSAVSGIQAQAFAMQNISGNIANSQTIAYKGINTSFEELIPGVSAASQQTAGGVFASSIGTNSSQGAIQNASSSTAMAINGDGYFVVQSPLGFTGNTPNFGGVDAYTRRGDFSLNAQGYLVNGSGYYLEGTPIDPTTGNPVGTTAAPLQFQSNFLPANPTTTITYGLNLPQTPQTAAYSSSVPNSELLNPADFTTGHDPTTGGAGVVIGADTWNLFYQTDSAATGTNPAWQNVGTDFIFDSTGQLSPAVNSVALTGVTVNNMSLGNITINSSAGAITQFASTNGNPTVN